MQAFLEPEIYEGAVTLTRPQASAGARQLRLVEDHRG
jgi:hypothetical protein